MQSSLKFQSLGGIFMNPLHAIELEELETVDVQNEEVKERFKIENLDQLNWAFRKISALNAQKKEIDELAQAELNRIKEWQEKETKPIQDSIQFFESLIKEYHQKMLALDPKKNKTLSTPFGKSKSRTTKESPEKGDVEKLLQHIKESGMDEFIKEDVKWGDFKKTLKIVEVNSKKMVIDEYGQIVPGVVIKPATTTFKVEVE